MKRRVLIVSPWFPPANSADMQRVRMSLPHFREFGWEPFVLAVEPEGGQDPLLALTIPPDVPVRRVRALPQSLTRKVGIGNIALRAMPALYNAGRQIIREQKIELVYFSTTMFLCMPLGRVWRQEFGVPYVLDIQDPWLSDYYEHHPESAPPPKYSVARRVNSVLEPWTMHKASGLIAVSDDYLRTLRQRYGNLSEQMCTTLPFGASRIDAELLDRHPQPNTVFDAADGLAHGVYVGRGGDDMATALRILFGALRQGREQTPQAFASVALHFVGTDYATDTRARKTVQPVAGELGVGDAVTEQTTRVPYFEALQLMKDASFLVLVGSDDPAYTASKVYPYLMTGKPVIAVVHENSSLVPLLARVPWATYVTFGGTDDGAVESLAEKWAALLRCLDTPAEIDWRVLEPYSAREMTRQQCLAFDRALAAAA